MSIPVYITLDDPAPEDCPTTLTEAYQLLRESLHAGITANIIPYITGAATPAVEDQDKVWHRVDVDGRPLGTYVFYSGIWRKQYSGNQDEIRFFSGDPAIHFDSTGLGIPGGQWDGFAICNGGNGTPNLSDKFIVGAKMDDLGVGYSTGLGPWKTNVTGETAQSGGQKDITLTTDTTFQPAVAEVKVGRWTADGNTEGVSLYGNPHSSNVTLQAASPGNLTPDAIPTLPPFYALAITKWVGYA